MTEAPPLIRLRGVGREHPSPAGTVTALHDVDLDIAAGEFVAVVGPSGAGKSTLLNVIGLLETPSTGRYELDGVDMGGLPERDRDELRGGIFGFVFQSSHALPSDSVARNLVLGLRMRGVARTAQRRRATELLTRFGLLARADLPARALSGGERQRLAIARAVAGDPRIVLADEPTGNLDSANAQGVVRALQDLHHAGVTVVLVTHDESIAAVAERRIRVHDGRVVPEGRAAVRPPETRPVEALAGTPVRRLGALLADALAGVTSRLGRVAFLLLAFVLGAGGIVAAVDLSASAANQVIGRLSADALDRVVAHPPADWSDARIAAALARIRTLDGVRGAGRRTEVAPADGQVALLPGSGRSDQFAGTILGEESALARLDDVATRPAGALARLDEASPSALLGSDAARALGIARVGPGSAIRVRGQLVPVVGVIVHSSPQEPLADAVVLSEPFAAGMPGATEELVIGTRTGYPPAVADAIPLAIAPDDPGAVGIETVADLRHLAHGVDADFSLLIGAISAAVLLLACLGAGATMYLDVVNRTGEIALRRAVGARRGAIRLMFLAEGALLGLGGGVAGAALGAAATVVFCLAQGWSPVVDPVASGAAVAAGLATGILTALLPAAHAARIDPARAIRV